MKDKFKQTSIFSTFKRKLDNIKWRRGSREEPVLLGIKSTRTNCEVSDDFEYIDSRRKDSDIYCSVTSLYCSTQRETLQETSQVPSKHKLGRKKKKGMLNFVSRSLMFTRVLFNREWDRDIWAEVPSPAVLSSVQHQDCDHPWLRGLSDELRQGPSLQLSVQCSSCQSAQNILQGERVAQVTTNTWDWVSEITNGMSCVMCVFVLRTQIATQGPTAGARAQSQYTRDWTGAAKASHWYLIKFSILTHRSCEKLNEKFPLQSPNLVLSVIKVRVAMSLNYFGFNLFNIMRHLQ